MDLFYYYFNIKWKEGRGGGRITIFIWIHVIIYYIYFPLHNLTFSEIIFNNIASLLNITSLFVQIITHINIDVFSIGIILLAQNIDANVIAQIVFSCYIQ